MLNIQYMFRRVTGTSNNSQKQTESTAHASMHHSMACALCFLPDKISQHVSKIAPRKVFLAVQM